jgi:hypothetical protein
LKALLETNPLHDFTGSIEAPRNRQCPEINIAQKIKADWSLHHIMANVNSSEISK